jgi:hypothetical protein
MDSNTNDFFDKRRNELQKIFDKFQESNPNIIFTKEAAQNVCEIYFNYLEFFRDYLEPESKVNIYKIVSGTELAIIKIAPIQHDDEETKLALNAKLAFFAGFNILFGWAGYDNDKATYLFKDEDLGKFATEHLTWLELLNPQVQYPYLSNAQTWRLLDLLLKNVE